MSKSTSTITAFLAALVATPSDESLPPITLELITDTNEFFKTIKKQTAELAFWQRFNDFHDQLVADYTIKERNKILESAGSEIDSDQFALGEITNTSLSAEEIIDSARKSFQKSGKEPLDWAATLTQWQP